MLIVRAEKEKELVLMKRLIEEGYVVEFKDDFLGVQLDDAYLELEEAESVGKKEIDLAKDVLIIPSYNMIRQEYDELRRIVKDVVTIEQAKQIAKERNLVIEINGIPLEKADGQIKNTDIIYINYKEYKHLTENCFYISNRRVVRIHSNINGEWAGKQKNIMTNCDIDALLRRDYQKALFTITRKEEENGKKVFYRDNKTIDEQLQSLRQMLHNK